MVAIGGCLAFALASFVSHPTEILSSSVYLLITPDVQFVVASVFDSP